MEIVNKHVNDLNGFEKKILVYIYFQVFSEAPRKEQIDRDELKKSLFTQNNTFTFIKVNHAIAGFVCSYPISFFKDKEELKKEYDLNTCYISDFAMLKDYRNNGYGNKLFESHIAYLSRYYNKAFIRCRKDMPIVNKIIINHNFELVNTYLAETNKEISEKNIYFKKL